MLATSAIGRQEAFTLIELMVVIAILTVMLAAFPLALRRMLPSRRIATAEQELVAKLHDAASRSAATGEPVRATFDELAKSLALGTRLRLVDPDGGRLSAIILYPDGSATPARFELADGQFHTAVVLSGLTGRVSIDATH
jgi:prepilin-type N-terminal cleavage/methylation domain-containing protein